MIYPMKDDNEIRKYRCNIGKNYQHRILLTSGYDGGCLERIQEISNSWLYMAVPINNSMKPSTENIT